MLTIYKASAGSGKTFTLALDYLTVLLGVKDNRTGRYRLNFDIGSRPGARRPNRHRGILAITFTNAATAEMKSRIIEKLYELTLDPWPAGLEYDRLLLEKFDCKPDELRSAAKTALSELLYDYSKFNVSTIDSFFQSVLRTFAYEVDHQGDYDLALDTQETVRQSVGEMLDELNHSRNAEADAQKKRLADWIRTFMDKRVSGQKSFQFFMRDGDVLKALVKTVSDALNETYGRYASELGQYLLDAGRVSAFEKSLADARDALKKPLDTELGRLKEAIRETGIGLGFFNSSAVSFVKKLMAGELPSEWSATVQNFADTPAGDEQIRKMMNQSACKNKYTEADCAPLALCIYGVIRYAVPVLPRIAYYNEVIENLGVLDFFGMAQKHLEGFLRSNNTVLLSDTGEVLRTIINDAELPFIYERLGQKLNNLLIDEFQDTSRTQWANLKPLVSNAVAENHDCLIIGDVKQSIYRFRNTDSNLLGYEVERDPDFADRVTLRGDKPAENTNHRSSPAVVRFNNTLFRRVAGRFSSAGYSNVVQALPDKSGAAATGYVRLKFTPETGAKEERRNEVMEEMAAEIRRQHDQGHYRWRDILILVRDNTEGRSVVEFLTSRHKEIPVLSAESLLLNSSKAVRTVMSLLRIVEKSYGETSTAEEPDDTPVYGSSEDVVMVTMRFNYFTSMGCTPEEAIAKALDRSVDVADIESDIHDIRTENAANLVTLLDVIILKKLSPRQREDEYAFLAALQDLAAKHLEGPDPSIRAFIEAYDANINKWAIKPSAALDAVEVMSVHKSKGLERDCVHIPFANWALTKNKPKLWLDTKDCFKGFDPDIVPPVLYAQATAKSALRNSVSPFRDVFEKEIELEKTDNLNCAYVAYTRAGRELMVWCGKTDSETSIGSCIFAAVREAASEEETASPDFFHNLNEFFDPASDTLTVGEPTLKMVRAKKGGRQVTPRAAGIYPVYMRDDTRELTSIDDAFAIDDDEAVAGKEGADRYAEAARKGSDLHAILSQTITLSDLDKAVADYCARVYPADDSIRLQYAQLLSEALSDSDERIRQWFDPANRISTERSIWRPGADEDEGGEARRPDRIIVSPDGSSVTVVDYKFTQEAEKEHFLQVENYKELLRALGFAEVKAYLWYPLRKDRRRRIKEV